VADAENFRVLIYNAPFTTGESATVVFGQPDFNQRNSANPNTAGTFGFPVDVAVDTAGDIWVADSMGSRVLEFKPPFRNGMDASLVISGGFPSSIAFDRKGDLWVANLTELLEYAPPFASGTQPAVVIGAYTSCDPGPYHLYIPPFASATTLCAPEAIAFDAKGDLWVGDFYDLRVLEFVPPFSNGMAASLELGQPAATAFTSNSSQGISATSVCGPGGLAIDSAGDIWVADSSCSRVLEFSPPFFNGMAASLVLGHPDFTQGSPSGIPPAEPDTLSYPVGLWFDGKGNLIVSDSSNGRVLIYAPPFSNGVSATTALGVPDLTTKGNPCLQGGPLTPAADTLCYPLRAVTF
jgi:sugar lactone lactonase YvrE